MIKKYINMEARYIDALLEKRGLDVSVRSASYDELQPDSIGFFDEELGIKEVNQNQRVRGTVKYSYSIEEKLFIIDTHRELRADEIPENDNEGSDFENLFGNTVYGMLRGRYEVGTKVKMVEFDNVEFLIDKVLKHRGLTPRPVYVLVRD